MSTSQDAPALIQYACERCKTRFVLPPSTRKLSIGGKVRAFSTGLSRTFRYHEGLGSSYDSARRQLLAKMDDEAYQSFVKSFRFCHECRQFVCNECWSTSRRSCLTCVAKSMTAASKPRPLFAPGPEIARPVVAAAATTRRGRVRRDAALVALGLAIILLVVEGGVLLGAFTPGSTQQPIIGATESPSATPSETPTEAPSDSPVVTAVPSDTPTALPSPSPSPSPSVSPGASPSALATAVPTVKRTPVPTKKPTPVPPPPTAVPAPTTLPQPNISCEATVVLVNQNFKCFWNNPWVGGATSTQWYANGNKVGSTMQLSPADTYTIQMVAVRGGNNYYSNGFDVTVTP